MEKKELSLGGWVATLIIAMIPIVNIIMLFVWGFSANEYNGRKQWARAQLIISAISIVLSILFGSWLISLLSMILAA